MGLWPFREKLHFFAFFLKISSCALWISLILCSNVYLLSLHFLIEFHISLCNKILFFGKLNKTFSIVTIASVLCVQVFDLELLLCIKFCVNSCYCLWVNWLLPFQKTTFFCIFQKKTCCFLRILLQLCSNVTLHGLKVSAKFCLNSCNWQFVIKN